MDGEEKRSDHVIYIKAQRVNGLAPFSRLTRRGEPIRRGDLPASKQFYKKKKRKTRNKKKKKEIRTAVSIVASYTPRGFFNDQPSPRGQEKTLGRTAIKIRSGIYRRNN